MIYNQDRRTYFLMTRLVGEGRFDDSRALLADLRESGTNTVWVSPPNPQLPFIEENPHGYWPSNHGDIDGELGGEDGFAELVAAARKQGISICVDLLLNHFGYGERFRIGARAVTAEDAHYFKPRKICDGPIHPDEERLWRELETETDPRRLRERQRELSRIPLFHLPSLEHENAEVRAYLFAAGKRFIDRGVDCFRVDAVKHVSLDFLHEVTEEWIAYARTLGRRLHFLWELAIDNPDSLDVFTKDALAQLSDAEALSVLDFPLARLLRRVLEERRPLREVAQFAARRVRDRLAVRHWVPMLENHDFQTPFADDAQRIFAYALSEFFSYQPTILHHGLEAFGAGLHGRMRIERVDPRGEIALLRTRFSDALKELRRARSAEPFEIVHQETDVLLCRRHDRGRSVWLALQRGESPVVLPFETAAETVYRYGGAELGMGKIVLPPRSVILLSAGA